MPLMYAFVARGQDVLCEYAAYQGNFSKVAAECLAKCPSHNAKFTYNADKHTFNFVVHNGFSARPGRARSSSQPRAQTSQCPHAASSRPPALTRPRRPAQPSWPWPTRSLGAKSRSASWRR